MDIVEKVRKLIALMSENDLAELEVQESDLRVKIKAGGAVKYAVQSFGNSAPMVPAAMSGPANMGLIEAPAKANPEPAKPNVLEITAPMVGTFYRAPSEGAEPYVSVGSVVDADTVVCILEAMKVMNEVKGEVSGEIADVLVQNAEPVEFGQVLFLVKPLEA